MTQASNGTSAQVDQLIEAILDLKFPARHAISLMARHARPGTKLPFVDEANAYREELRGKSHADLVSVHSALMTERNRQTQQAAADRQAKAEAKAKAAEAKRFYNVPAAIADVGYWARMDFWTAEESLALLLGRDPRVVTTKAVLREIADTKMLIGPPMSRFLEQYEELRALASRAEAMSRPQLRPSNVLAWAQIRSRVQPPPDLAKAVAEFASGRQPELAIPNLPDARSASRLESQAAPTPRAARRDILAPVFERAQAQCSDRFDVAEVWGRLQAFATSKEPPLFGSTEDGIQYHKDGGVGILTREAVAKRVQRSRARS